MISRILLIFISFFFTITLATATVNIDNNVRDVSIGDTGKFNDILDNFNSPSLKSFFFTTSTFGAEGVTGAFTTIAFQIKNFFIAIAVVFLIVGVIKLLFSSSDEENVKKWKSNIIWTSVGIFIMQTAFSVWSTLILNNASDNVGGNLGGLFWQNILLPIVYILQMLAAFGFLMMAVWAFFMMVSANGDEEKVKKGKNTILYAIIGFLLIKIPETLVKAIYGKIDPCTSGTLISSCTMTKPQVQDSIGIAGKIFTFLNTFLSIICVLLIIYAAWLVFISGGEEEKLKKAKSIVLYIILGFIVLVGSNAIFRFFILEGNFL